MQKDYYFILGIASDASIEVIKKAYRINAIKYHPDKNSGDPAFDQKFMDIKEAYDNLIDNDKRRDFDLKYKQFFKNKSREEAKSFQSQEEKKEEKSQSFKYDPFVRIFSSYDRAQQETSPNPPRQTPWGNPIHDNVEFLKFPRFIGKIIGGGSNIFKGEQINTPFTLMKSLSKAFLITLIATIVFGFLHYLHLKNSNIKNPLQFILIIWSIITTILIFGIYKFNRGFADFNGFNYYIGISGFAFYKFKDSKDNLIESIEINFNEVTDIFSSYATNEFAWINRNLKKLIYREPAPNKKIEDAKFTLNKYAEKFFTIYLLDNMEKELENKGYIEFILAPSIPYIRLGIGFITFLIGNKSFTYNFDDIKRIYTQEMQLYIEHKNYQKVLFFKSGNQNTIPLQFLCNRQFFYKAMEILLGYRIN